MKLYVQAGGKKKGARVKALPRFNFPVNPAQMEELRRVAREFTKTTGVQVSAAFLLRLAISECLPKWREELRQAQKGRYHAKIRAHYERLGM